MSGSDDGGGMHVGDIPAYGVEVGGTPHEPDQPAVPFPDVAPSEEEPGRGRGHLAPFVFIGVAIIAVIAVASVLVMSRTGAQEGAPDSVGEAAPTPAAHTATDCTHSVSSGEVPTNGTVSAGGLFFPRSVAPRWQPKPEHRVPNSIDAVSLDEEVSDMGDMVWIGQLTVGITNFDQSMSLADQAKLMFKCVLGSDLYEGASASVAELTPTPGRLDGTPTSTIEAPVTVAVADPSVRGDDVVVVVVGTRPSTYFLATSPFGDVHRRAIVQAAREALQLSPV
jgi:hypothetical protein